MDEMKSFELTRNYVVRKVVDETILVPVSPQLKERDTLLVLNSTAASFLEKIRAGEPRGRMLAELAEEFDCEPGQLAQDFQEFLETMMQAEVIRERQSKG